MRKILLLVFSFLSLFSFGQGVKFMNLDMNMSAKTFCQKLKTKGLEQTIDRFETKEYKGAFATYPDCRIVVTTTETSDKIKSIEVIFESVRNDEYERNKAFNNLLLQYKNKYGEGFKETYNDDTLGAIFYSITIDGISVKLLKLGPPAAKFLGDDCSLSIMYVNEKTVDLKEKNPSKYSSDI